MKNKRLCSIFVLTLFVFYSFFNPPESFAEEEKFLIPGGQIIGVTLSCDGVLVTGVSEIFSGDGTFSSPAEEAGIKSGDIITKIDGKDIGCVDDLKNIIKNTNADEHLVTLFRGEKMLSLKLSPAKNISSEMPCLGMWVKDAASGVGTLTFFDPENGHFAALGHGILNSETGEVLPIDDGKILNAKIVEIKKGEKGIPGEIKGSFSESDVLGKVEKNNSFGLFGKSENQKLSENAPLLVGKRCDVKKGKAYIYTTVDSDVPEKYEIEIIKFSNSDDVKTKGIVIRITDSRLLEKTGGIVQGMSGSPIIQDGKLVGAVTHVFVNDPTRGYGIFIENMLSEAEKIK